MKHNLAYCTNVHAGSDFTTMRENIERFSLAVKTRFAPHQAMGIGLWIAAPAARELLESTQLAEFRNWLADQGLLPFTFNGFPYGDFHRPVVKHRVYEPTWFELQRRDYTLDLIRIQDALLPAGQDGSISTLPIAWGTPFPTSQQLAVAAGHLATVADQLAELEARTGRLITVCLEPEPGCVLQRCDDMISFFSQYLCPSERDQYRKRFIRVCHDICHSAVMFEDQRDVLQRYADQGISVGKVQVSSAIEVDFDQVSAHERAVLVDALADCTEERYLHQTSVRTSPDALITHFEDLPLALAAAAKETRYLSGKWRVHFHVPIYADRFGPLQATQQDIIVCLEACELHPELTHFEVETYAWGVLPTALQRANLADGIADEMNWLRDHLPAS